MKANVDYTLCLVYKRQFEKDGTCTKYTLGQEFKIKILKTQKFTDLLFSDNTKMAKYSLQSIADFYPFTF